MMWCRAAPFGRLGVTLAVALNMASSPVYGQAKIGPAPPGDPKSVASAAIREADHPCGRVLDAVRLNTGGIRAVCSNGDAYRVFTVEGKVVAMKCSAAARLGISGC